MKLLMSWIACLALVAGTVVAQESAKSLVDAAGKKVASAKGKAGEEMVGILKEAATLYETVEKKFPQSKPELARAALELGRVRRRLGEMPGAEAALKSAASHTEEPKIAAEALHDLATVYRREKKMPEAQQALERIVTEFTSQPRERAEALLRLGGLHRQAKKMDLAEESLRRVLADHSDIYSAATDALDDLVALKVLQDKDAEAQTTFKSHGEALKTRYQGTRYEPRLQIALDRIALRLKAGAADGE